MAENEDEFQLRVRRDADEVRRTDFADKQDEMAGRPNGRMRRFLPAGVHDERNPEKRAESRALSRLQMLLASDPAYAALYRETFEKLREAEEATEKALLRATSGRDDAEQELQRTLERAHRLEGGTRVFRDKQGRVWTERGQQVDAALAASIDWRGDEPSYEDYRAGKDAASRAQKEVTALRSYQVDVLGHIRDRMTDEEKPTTKKEMEQFQQTLEGPLAGFSTLEPPGITSKGQEIKPVPSFDLPKM